MIASEEEAMLPLTDSTHLAISKRKQRQSCLAQIGRLFHIRAPIFVLILLFIQTAFILSIFPLNSVLSTPAAVGQTVSKYVHSWPSITLNEETSTSSANHRSQLETLASSRLEYLQHKLTRDHLERKLAIKTPEYNLQAYKQRLRRYYDAYIAPLNESKPSSDYQNIWSTVESHLIPGRAVDEAIPHVIYSATRSHANVSTPFQKWKQDHPTWKIEVYDEDEREIEVKRSFAALGRSSSNETIKSFLNEWLALPYPMLKIDTFRYLKVFLEGGVWSDGDAGSVYNVLDWPGMSGPEPDVVVQRQDDILHLLEAMPRLHASKTNTNGSFEDIWSGGSIEGSTASSQRWSPPGLAFEIEFDAPNNKKPWKELSLSRPLQLAQAIFMARRFHPVLLDCVGTIMATAAENKNVTLPSTPKGKEYTELVLDWTGPGVFTDAVLRYMVARYGLDPVKAISGLSNQAARIGDMLVYPEFAFQASMLNGTHSRFEMAHHE